MSEGYTIDGSDDEVAGIRAIADHYVDNARRYRADFKPI